MRRSLWIALGVFFGLPATAIAFGGGVWPFELAHHFVVHLAAAAFGAGAAFALRGLRAPALVAGLLAFAYGTHAMTAPAGSPAAGAIRADAAPPGEIEIVAFNILADQRHPRDLLDWLAKGPGDVLVLLEITPIWQRRLASLKGDYPHRVMALPREPLPADADHDLADKSGIAILSRLPLHDVRVFYPGGPVKPAVIVRLADGAGGLILAAAHPAAPTTRSGLAARDDYLAGLAEALDGSAGPLVVAGDFNATPFAPVFRRFVDRLQLAPPRQSPATFPAVAGPFGLAIDHVLVRDVGLARLDILPPMGSDHRGLRAHLRLPGSAGKRYPFNRRITFDYQDSRKFN